MIVAVINLKGGVGKTTSSVALATAAARDGRDAVVLDTDPQSSASLWAMPADDLGEPLPFDVRSANLATLKRLRAAAGGFTVIDTPPSGKVTDAAKDAADVVVVPTSPASIDLQQTWATVDALREAGKPYAILVVRAETATTAYKAAMAELAGRDESYFDNVIRKRADLASMFGHRFAGDLYGYEDVYKELKEMMQ